MFLSFVFAAFLISDYVNGAPKAHKPRQIHEDVSRNIFEYSTYKRKPAYYGVANHNEPLLPPPPNIPSPINKEFQQSPEAIPLPVAMFEQQKDHGEENTSLQNQLPAITINTDVFQKNLDKIQRDHPYKRQTSNSDKPQRDQGNSCGGGCGCGCNRGCSCGGSCYGCGAGSGGGYSGSSSGPQTGYANGPQIGPSPSYSSGSSDSGGSYQVPSYLGTSDSNPPPPPPPSYTAPVALGPSPGPSGGFATGGGSSGPSPGGYAESGGPTGFVGGGTGCGGCGGGCGGGGCGGGCGCGCNRPCGNACVGGPTGGAVGGSSSGGSYQAPSVPVPQPVPSSGSSYNFPQAFQSYKSSSIVQSQSTIQSFLPPPPPPPPPPNNRYQPIEVAPAAAPSYGSPEPNPQISYKQQSPPNQPLPTLLPQFNEPISPMASPPLELPKLTETFQQMGSRIVRVDPTVPASEQINENAKKNFVLKKKPRFFTMLDKIYSLNSGNNLDERNRPVKIRLEPISSFRRI